MSQETDAEASPTENTNRELEGQCKSFNNALFVSQFLGSDEADEILPELEIREGFSAGGVLGGSEGLVDEMARPNLAGQCSDTPTLDRPQHRGSAGS